MKDYKHICTIKGIESGNVIELYYNEKPLDIIGTIYDGENNVIMEEIENNTEEIFSAVYTMFEYDEQEDYQYTWYI